MKNSKHFNINVAALLGLILVVGTSCERGLSDDVELATFSKTGEIFTDNFVGLGSNFYFPFVGDGAKPDVFSVDEDVAFAGTASIRIDVPNADDPGGGFAGASFVIDGSGRNLTDYDALTFWAKSSQAATIGSIGFGREFRAGRTNVDFTTSWQKFIIPIPDPSKLIEVKSVFEFAAGGIGPVGEEVGYTFWIDELQFENLGTVAQPRPAINNGVDTEAQSFSGSTITLEGLTQTFNLATGANLTVSAAPSYFQFSSSDLTVATVDDLGVISLVGAGTTDITAVLGGVPSAGSLSIDVLGSFASAPTPTNDPADVISIFSDAYTDVPVDNYNGFFGGQTTLGGAVDFGGDGIIQYTNLNFVAISTTGTVDASAMTHLHVDVQVSEPLDAADALIVELIDFGPNGAFDGAFGTDDTGGGTRIVSSSLAEGTWISLDLPLNGFTQGTGGGFSGSPNISNIAQVVFVSGGISEILVDNVYFYR